MSHLVQAARARAPIVLKDEEEKEEDDDISDNSDNSENGDNSRELS